MKILNLIIKQVYFDQILAGTKTQEFREVKPTTINKLLQQDAEGYEVEDENGNALPIEYDAIRFFVGYNKNRDSALVEVKGAHCEIFTDVLRYENDEPIFFKCDKNKKVLLFATDKDGKFVKDEDGEFVITEDEENGCPMPAEDNEEGVTIEVPIEYEHGGKLWIAEQVVFDLGKVLEKDVHKK